MLLAPIVTLQRLNDIMTRTLQIKKICIYCVCVWGGGGGGGGGIAKWLGHLPGDRKVTGSIPRYATLVLLLFP